MLWVIQDGFFSEFGYRNFVGSIQRLKRRHLFVRPQSSGELLREDSDVPAILDDTEALFPMGSYTLARIGVSRGWRPGAITDNLDFSTWSAAWGAERILNAGARTCRFEDADFEEEAAFVRPVEDNKAFSGKVYERGEWRGWKRELLVRASTSSLLSAETQVVISRPRTIFSETRCWVVDGKVVTVSGYRRGRQVHYTEGADDEVIDFARTCIAHWTPNRAFVLDVAQTPEGCKVIEVNCLNAAGFYASDTQKLVAAIEDGMG